MPVGSDIALHGVGGEEQRIPVPRQLAVVAECQRIHVSFDVDSLDPSISVGTGTPVPDGLYAEEASILLQGFCKDRRIATLDVVEINPALDVNNAMAEATLSRHSGDVSCFSSCLLDR